jgi:hypothetical protein
VLKRLDRGDVLIVTRLDRLARSTRDLLNILDDIAKRGAGFKSLHDAWADTTSAHGRRFTVFEYGLSPWPEPRSDRIAHGRPWASSARPARS